MSDDRNKQDQHPIDRHAPQQDQYGDDDEKTQLVDLESLQSGGNEPQFAPPPTIESSPSPMGSGMPGTDDHEAATQLFEIPPSMDDDGDAVTSSAPDFDAPHNARTQRQKAGQNFDSGPVSGNLSSVKSDPVSFGSGGGGGGGGNDQVFVPSDDEAGYEGSTQFVNISDFAEQKAHFTPEQEEAGYAGSTQFVDVNALKAGSAAGAGDPIDGDQDLHRGYQFAADDISRGEITLIFAKNPLGKDIILKRVWEGRPEEMSTPLRERISQLHELKHPNLVAMNGMFVSASGMWVELDAPRGKQLTNIIQDRGGYPLEVVLDWMGPVAEVLELVHGEHLAYANLTTDAVWITDDGKVSLEPFDMLRLDNRGNLGAFGPPEMDAPPDQRQLSPASDIYSLAAITAAALTGLPLQFENLAELGKKSLVKKIHKALVDDPAERPQSAREFIKNMQGGSLDIRIVGAAAAAVMVVILLLLVVLTGDDPPPPQPAVDESTQAQADGDAEETGEGDEAVAGTEEEEESPTDGDEEPEQGEGVADFNLPAEITTDSRLTISTSFEQNPPADLMALATPEQLERWREEARELIEEAEGKSSRSDKYEHYTSALERLTHIIRSQEEPPPEDWDKWEEVYNNDVVQNELKSLIETLDQLLLEGRMGSANRRYRRLANINPNATADSFLSVHNSAQIVSLGGANEDDDD